MNFSFTIQVYEDRMQRPTIPFHQIRDLRCRHCQMFISCGPVYVVPDSSVLCGRCRMLAKDIYRNYAFEAVASMFLYPCINWENHCPATLQWNESLEHEEECNYHGCCSFMCAHPGAWFKGKREMPQGGDIRFYLPDHLLDHIKCVLCDCYLSCEPIYIQTNGKNICHRCVNSNGVPPNCLRNLAYEKLAQILTYPCIYRNRGCPTRLRFGREIWQHETVCSYGQIFKKIADNPNNASGKKRGVIKTHSGHTYGTITPNSQLFAPPKDEKNDINKEVIKSLMKKQDRKMKRADELGDQFHRMNSEDSSSTNDGSYRGVSASGSSTPDNSFVNQSYVPEDNHVANVHQMFPEHHSNQNSRNNSVVMQKGYHPNVMHTRQSSGERPPPYTNEYLASHFPIFPGMANLPNRTPNNDILASHFPVFPAMVRSNSPVKKSNSFGNQDRVVGRFPSINGNKDLINELKIRQGLIQRTSSIKKSADDSESPYRRAGNLEEILQIHDQIKRE